MIADLRDLFVAAVESHASRWWRTAALGAPVAIGVAMVVASFGASASARLAFDESMERMGADRVVVTPSPADGQSDAPRLPADSIARAEMLREVHAVGSIAEQVGHTVQPSPVSDPLAPSAISTRVLAASASLADAARLEMSAGRFFSEVDDRQVLEVAIVGADVATEFAIDRPHQSSVLIDGHPYPVIGTLEPAEGFPLLDRSVLVPFSTASRQWGDDGRPSQLVVRTSMHEASAVAEVLPRLITFDEGPRPTARTATELLAARRAVDDTMNLLVAASGGLVLLLGVSGIAFALWAAVLARTSEIGVRRALGATRRDIATLFLLEASLVGAAAVIAGGVAGPLIAAAIARAQGWPSVIDWSLLAATCALAMEITIVAGLVPARRAARLDPLSALRA